MKPTLGTLLLALVLVGCGGSDEPEAKSTPDTTAELRAAAQAYSDAFLTGEASVAYRALSARCRARESEAEFGAVVARAAKAYGDALPFKTFDAEVSGDLARVSYTYSVAGINQDREPWVREGGVWRQDDC